MCIRDSAGTAAAAAKAGVAAIVAPTAEEAAEKAAHIVGLLQMCIRDRAYAAWWSCFYNIKSDCSRWKRC